MSRLRWSVSIAVVALGVTGCNRTPSGPDPATANLAPAEQAGDSGQVAETEPVANREQLTAAPQPPPPLPDYSQPPCPGDNYLWTPGYWAYSDAGYYWVPGAWVAAPWVGALWTPPYWGYSGGRYLWHAGYWGPYVGFYGGIDYGFGYTGRGFEGGYWREGAFNYNRAALNVNVNVVRNVYRRPVVNYTPYSRVSYNGSGGVNVQASASEAVAFRERRMGAAPAQVQLNREAAGNRSQFATENRGRPAMTAAEHPVANLNPRPATQVPGRQAEPQATRPQMREQAPLNRPEAGGRPAERSAPPAAAPRQLPVGRVESHPQPLPRQEVQHPAPQARPGTARPAPPQARPEAAHSAPQPQARPEAARPAPPQARPEAAHSAPQPQARPEAARPAPPQARPEAAHSAPQPQPRPEAARPAPPQARPEAAHSAPQPQPRPEAARPAPAPRQEPPPVQHQAKPAPDNHPEPPKHDKRP